MLFLIFMMLAFAYAVLHFDIHGAVILEMHNNYDFSWVRIQYYGIELLCVTMFLVVLILCSRFIQLPGPLPRRDLQAGINEALQDIQHLKLEKLESEQDNEELVKKYDQKCQDVNSCRSENNRLHSAIIATEENCEYWKCQHHARKEAQLYYQQKSNTLEHELQKARGEIVDLKKSQGATSPKLDESRTMNQEIIVRIDSTHQHQDSTPNEQRASSSAIRKASKFNPSERYKIKAALKRKENASIMAELAAAQQQHHDQQQTIEKLQNVLEEKEGELRDLAASGIEDTNDVEIKSCQAPTKDQLKDHTELEAKTTNLVDTQQQPQDQQQKITKLQQEVERLEKILEEKEGQLMDLAASSIEDTSETGKDSCNILAHSQLKDQVEALESALVQFATEMEVMKEQLKNLGRQKAAVAYPVVRRAKSSDFISADTTDQEDTPMEGSDPPWVVPSLTEAQEVEFEEAWADAQSVE